MSSNQRPPVPAEDMGQRGDWNVSRIHSGNLSDLYQFLDGVGPGNRVWVVAHGYVARPNGDSGTAVGEGYVTLIGSTPNEGRDQDWFRASIDEKYNEFDSVDFFDVNWRATPGKRRSR